MEKTFITWIPNSDWKQVGATNERIKAEYPVQDDFWPSRRWKEDGSDYCDMSGYGMKKVIATHEGIKPNDVIQFMNPKHNFHGNYQEFWVNEVSEGGIIWAEGRNFQPHEVFKVVGDAPAELPVELSQINF